MKDWFPFTDYDFYAYITAGMVVLFSLDYGFNHGQIMWREEWPFVHIVFIIAMAYLIGQITAGLASILLEHWITRRVLRSPVAVMMELGKPTFSERFIGQWVVGRYYEPLPDNTRLTILKAVAENLEKKAEEIDDPEDVFQSAFPIARTVSDAATRMDDFRKLYGFSRNVALSGLVGAGALLYRAVMMDEHNLYWWVLAATICSAIMFGRFLKFYAAYGAEVLRTYASVATGQGK